MGQRLLLHWLALLFEGAGTFFVLFEARRIEARMPKIGFTLGDPKGWESWIYHCGIWGVSLVLLGILLQGIALALEHREWARRR